MRHLVFGLGVVLALPGPTRAQSPARTDAARYVVRQWDSRSGLPQNTVNDIVQTPDGYLWLATFGGLVRFDGVRFTVFSSRGSEGIGSDRDLSLAVDSAGSLWVGTENGLIRLAGGSFITFTAHDGLSAPQVDRVFVDRRGVVWAINGGRISRGDAPGSGRFITLDGLPGPAHEIDQDDAGLVWAHTEAGLARYDPASGRFVADSSILPPRGVVRILGRQPDGGLWLSAPGALVSWRRGVRTIHPIPGALAASLVRVAVALDGSLWLASDREGGSLLDLRGAAVRRRYAVPGGGNVYAARAVYVDRQGVPWIGTNVDGLLELRRRVFTMLDLVQHEAVSTTAILGDRQGRVWIGANCDGVNVLENGRLRVFRSADGRDIQCVWSLAEDEGSMWLGTWGGYLVHLERERTTRIAGADGLRDSVVLSLLRAADGSLWVGTLAGGVDQRRDGRRIAHFDTSNGLPDNRVNTIVESPDGAVWVGTIGGLTRIGGGALKTFTTRQGLSHNHVRAIHLDSDGTIWIGTYGGGLMRMRDSALVSITAADGLFDDAVSAIVDDGRGNFWISGNRGIFRVSRDELDAFADRRARSVHSVAYGEADGLTVAETNGGFSPAAWRAPDGRIWFPTIRGVAILDPSAVVADRVAPRVYIERLVIDGRAVPVGGAISMSPGSGNVEVMYTALSSPAPEAVVFRYRLEGVDRDWVFAGDRRSANYAHLPPGTYRFTVSAANRDGVWSDAGASLRLLIRPPLAATWWFRLGILLVLASVTAGVVRLRLAERTLRAEQAFARRLIEGQEAERKRIASEMHDSIGQDLLVVKNRAELALRTTLVEGHAREQLEQISRIVSDTLRHTREIAHNLRPAQLDRLGLAAAIRSAVEQVVEASGIAFTVEAGQVDGILPPVSEIGVFRIVQEGVNNILKHAHASAANIVLARDNGDLRIVISDNGGGFQRQRAEPAGSGLSGIAERVKLMGGSMEVRSIPGAGVTLTIRIPASPRRA